MSSETKRPTGERTCREVLPLLDALVDGELDADRAAAIQAHLGVCTGCQARLDATRELVEAARSLAPIDPPDSLLGATFQRLAVVAAEEAERPPMWWWWKAWRKTILAGGLASLAVGAFALSLVVRARRQKEPPPRPPITSVPETDLYLEAVREVARADEEHARAVAELRQIVAEERPRWRPEVARAFDENLAVIDRAVQRQREIARRQPGDFAAQDALASAYKKELDFLQEAVVRGEASEGEAP